MPKLGILAGRGLLPRLLAEDARAKGDLYFILGFAGQTDTDWLAAHAPHYGLCASLGLVGEALERLKAAGVDTLVLAGGMQRPSWRSLSLDKAGAKLLARLGRGALGDDTLLRSIMDFLEEQGFQVIGAQARLGGLLLPARCLTRTTPDAQHRQDIQLGRATLSQLSPMDIGQAVVVQEGRVLGIEGVEGTDGLIQRLIPFIEPGRAVLVKAAKTQQDIRADLPALGGCTLTALHQAGYAGVAAEAGKTLLLDSAATLAAADAGGLFVVGV